VADRWHLLHNLSERLERLFRRYETVLFPKPGTEHLNGFDPAPSSPQAAAFEQVQTLYEQGVSVLSIAQQLHIDYNKLRSFVQLQPWARNKRPTRHADLQPFLPQVHRLWMLGSATAA
jgi:hypothetical protein